MIRKAVSDYLSQHNLSKLPLKAVLFDMDGVLYDSMGYHSQAWYETACEYKLESTPEDFYLFEGRTGDTTIDELFLRTFGHTATAEQKQEIYARKMDLFNAYNNQSPMPGATELLQKIKEYQLERIVVTGSGQHSLIDNLYDIYPGYFSREKTITAYDVQYGKPKPEPYLMGLKMANARLEEALVIENAPLGVEAGVAAGIFTIAVNTGPLPDRVLWEAGANLLYPDMISLASDWDHLMEIIRSL